MKNHYRQYIQRTLILAGLVILTVGAVNLLIDPYNYFGFNSLGVYISAEREAKATLVRAYPHNALLMGNSRAAMIPASTLQGYRFFNAAFRGARPEEMYHFINRFAHTEKLVLLAIDLGDYHSGPVQGDIFARKWQDVLEKVLSLKNLEYSIRTMVYYVKRKPKDLNPDGSFNSTRWFELYDRENIPEFEWTLKSLKQGCDSYSRPAGAGMDYFRRIALILRDRNIACVVFIPPVHEELARYIRQSKNYSALLAWKQELTSLFPCVLDFSMGPYSEAKNFFKPDPVHFKPEVGTRLINQEIIPATFNQP